MPHILTIEIIGAIIKLKEVIGMITFISRHIALLFLNKNIINKEKLPVCQYGVEMIISLIIGFLSVLLTGIIMNCLCQ